MKGRYEEGEGNAPRPAPHFGGGVKWMEMVWVRVISSCLAGDEDEDDSPLAWLDCTVLIETRRDEE